MRMRGPGLGPKPDSRSSEKSHVLGAAPCYPKRKGGPLYAWKNRGIFAVVGSGQRCPRVCLHVRPVLAHRAQVLETCGGRGLLIAGCKCPGGSGDGVGTPRATQGTWLLESSLENPPPRPPVPKSVLRTLSVRGWECCWAVWPRGNRAVLCVAGRASVSTEVPRDPVKLL